MQDTDRYVKYHLQKLWGGDCGRSLTSELERMELGDYIPNGVGVSDGVQVGVGGDEVEVGVGGGKAKKKIHFSPEV